MLRDLWLQVWPERLSRLEEVERDLNGYDPVWRPKLWIEPQGFAVADPLMGTVGEWMLEIGVVPAARRKGVGRRLLDAATDGLQGEAFVRVAESDEESLGFAHRRGFVERKIDFPFLIDPQKVDSSLLQAWSESEIEIVFMADLDSGEFRRAIHELFETVRIDIPRATPPKRMDFEQFEAHVLGDDAFCWEGSLVARDSKGGLIGMSGVFNGGESHTLDQWLLAVRREWRGRGLARALKARGLLWARANGIREIRTDNDSRNAPMLSINDRIGFIRQRGLWSLSKKFGEPL